MRRMMVILWMLGAWGLGTICTAFVLTVTPPGDDRNILGFVLALVGGGVMLVAVVIAAIIQPVGSNQSQNLPP